MIATFYGDNGLEAELISETAIESMWEKWVSRYMGNVQDRGLMKLL